MISINVQKDVKYKQLINHTTPYLFYNTATILQPYFEFQVSTSLKEKRKKQETRTKTKTKEKTNQIDLDLFLIRVKTWTTVLKTLPAFAF